MFWLGVLVGLVIGLFISHVIHYLTRGLTIILLQRQENREIAAHLELMKQIKDTGIMAPEGDEGGSGGSSARVN